MTTIGADMTPAEQCGSGRDNERTVRDDEANVRRRVADAYGRIAKGGAGCGESLSAESLPAIRGNENFFEPREAAASYPSGCASPAAVSAIEPGEVVLDLGCGAGLDLLQAADKVGPSGLVIGVDMTDEMITRARANVAAARYDNIEVRRGIVEDLPAGNETVDWVISNCVINLSPNKAQVFSEIARVLKPGGRMRIADIVADELPTRIRQSRRLYNSCIAGAISENEYVAGLRGAGLIDVALGCRYVYDRSELVIFTAGTQTSAGESAGVADALVGRVWSVHIAAARPLREPNGATSG
jgi:SAM-dependent methyltransferase